VPRPIDAIVVVLRGDEEVATWPLIVSHVDLRVVDELARLHLAARRLGCTIRLRQVCPGLCELLDLVGISEVLTDAAG
jgi:hypothetical protein